MNLPEVTIEQLLEAGVHFGHNIRRWNPKMEQYIFGVRNKIHIIDLRITLPLINSALVKLHETVSKSGKVLIVGTKKQCSSVISDIASETNQFYVNKRWLGGTLTNWKTISNSIKKLDELEILLSDNKTNNLSKKELLNISRDKDKLISNIGGIRNLAGKPDLVVVFDVVKDKLAVLEANKLGVPVIAIVDTNANPELIDFPIPGNDDAIRSINLYAELFKETIIDAKKHTSNDTELETKSDKDLKNTKNDSEIKKTKKTKKKNISPKETKNKDEKKENNSKAKK
ncbi:MAG: 30S ribosomal protein S2 [Alphaproteobacteria bacterium MarineAlpha5_Bin8]|nr:MAG: 30S ribosomal protein S2 [Alphaproteobacteria bacterium MarineAlpha5_Bin7]PPR47499.1 MAG: 30S ribosomal protein S2 [Alphaproteobacteria bacterium MarineAlpha5_Bin8]PPR53012.1 MAG: 30S ribosomal protein S2 [Alphaproteobacteria bacterium MarineAlpha5_Bin6]|tara:strand:- start:1711 stop:2565 length:855 start_codon:yes stop_codon:yes gene_type:complete